MEEFISVIEIIGTIAFAFTGSVIAIERKLDVFGVLIIGTINAIGGGMIRDMIIGVHPSNIFSSTYLIYLSLLVALLTFIYYYLHKDKPKNSFEKILLVSDSLGLGVFTVIGIENTVNAVGGINHILLVLIGVVTACGGGVLRDVLTGVTPQIFVRHFYASASLIGAEVFVILTKINNTLAVFCTVFLIVILRLLAAHFRWNLPKIS